MNKSNLMRSCAFVAMPILGGVMLPSAAYAQSTGTLETEKDTIVVTGTRTGNGIGGIVVQDSTKAKGLITQDYIAKQNPGQTIINAINYIPGATFTQNDPYGSSGGNIRIRGFDGNRVSVTFDGVPLNDSGNYAIYTNQILDPELVEQVNVNLGATDVDSPTASAAGGTINFRSLIPTDVPSARATLSAGTFDYRRAFGMINTGRFGPWGTKGWLAASTNTYDHWRGPGKIKKWQINAKLYQELGNNGDFVSLAGHYNENRNNNYSNPNLSGLRGYFGSADVPSSVPTDGYVTVGDYSDSQWDVINDDANAYSASCRRATPGGGAQSDPSACTSYIGAQINPSNTGNVRGQSRFTLTDGLILTVDPTYQYTLANGGTQTTVLSETDDLLTQGTGMGVDLNGDGDTLDRVLVGRPSITNTNRLTVLTSLVWRMNPSNTFRVAYTYDRAHHRQTGEYGYTDLNSNIVDEFFGRDGTPILTATGNVLQNRDRTSIALLNQISGQYIGKFMENKLRVELGLRVPFFKRELDQHCYTPVLGAGFPVCFDDATAVPGYTVVPNDIDPTTVTSTKAVYAPFQRDYKYSKALPNIGLTYNVTDAISVFGSYAKGFSAPRTDNLYRQPFIGVEPETTNSFDLGARYITRRAQAQATLWKIGYNNRIVTSYDPETNISIDRNVGRVNSWGLDASVGVRPTPQISLLALASYTNAKLKDDLLIGTVNYNSVTGLPTTALSPYQYYCGALPTTGSAPVNVCDETSGKFVVETPKWQFGGRAEFNFNPVSVGIQAKHVGDRWATDVNDVKSKGYTTVDLDARVKLPVGNDKTYFQLNVTNLFNAHYFGNLSTSINAFGVGRSDPRFTPVAGRSVMGSLSVGF